MRFVECSPEEALDHVAGFAVSNDVSERTWQLEESGGQWSKGKCAPTFNPLGPWLVTPDEVPDPDDLALGCSVDGETVQDARTSDLIFTVPRLVAELSAVLPLLPGDVLFTGTPAGVGALGRGDEIEGGIDGLGILRTRIE